MNFVINGKISASLLVLGEGREGITYYDGKYAIKVLSSYTSKLILKEEDINRLKNINVNILNHPIACAYNQNNKYLGPVSLCINEDGYHNFRTVSSKKFIDIMYKMKEDAKTYAQHHYFIADLQLKDSLFDRQGNLHLVDSGSYQYREKDTISMLENENQKEVERYLLDEVLDSMMALENISIKKRKNILKHIADENDIYSSLEERIKNYPSVIQYVKTLKRR